MRRLAFVLALALLVPARVAGAQETPATAPAATQPAAPVVVPPELTRFEEAKLPPDLGVGAGRYVVTLAVTVDETGAVTDVLVTAADSDLLVPLALEAAKRFAFKPATVDGQPVAVQITYRYAFDIRPKDRVIVYRVAVRQKGSRDAVDGVTVLVEENGRSFTSHDGVLEVSDLPPGTYTLYLPEEEYVEVRQEIEVVAGAVGDGVMWVERRYGAAHQTVIRAPKEARFVAKQSLEAAELRRLPGAGGDPLKMIEDLPGVAHAPFGNGMLIVFGADFLDTQVLLDGLPMWWFYHFGGLYSTINPGFIDRIDFYPAAFDATYGGATGGIVDVHLKEEPLTGIHGAVDVNFLHAGAILGIPYSKDGEVEFAFRRSYIDAILKALPLGDALSLTTAPRYYDYQFKWQHRFGEHNRVMVFVNGSDDSMEILNKNADLGDPSFVGSLGLSMWIHSLMARWTSEPTDAIRNVLSVKALPMGFDMNAFGAITLKVTQVPVHLRDELEWKVDDKLKLRFGVEGFSSVAWLDVKAPTVPGSGATPTPLSTQEIIQVSERIFVMGASPYFSAEWQPFPWWTLVPSVRLDAFWGDWKSVSADPRLSMRFQLAEQWALKAGGGLYQQPPPVYTFSNAFGGGHLGPEAAVHALVGLEYRPLDNLVLTAEGFYKYLFHLTEPSKDKTVRYTSEGYGRAFGGDVMLRMNPGGGPFFGWLAYTYVVAQRWDFDTHEYRSADTDQRHVLTLVGTYELPDHWSIGLRFRLSSGYPYTSITGAVFDADGDQYSPIANPYKNTQRMPLFHQLDLRVDKEWVFDLWKLALYLEVQNVYYQKNAEGIQFNYDFSQTSWISGLPILPVFGVKGEF